MTSKFGVFTVTNALGKAHVVYTADSFELQASHIGNISTPNLSLHDAFLVPQLILNLIFVGQLCELGLLVHFSNADCVVQEP